VTASPPTNGPTIGVWHHGSTQGYGKASVSVNFRPPGMEMLCRAVLVAPAAPIALRQGLVDTCLRGLATLELPHYRRIGIQYFTRGEGM